MLEVLLIIVLMPVAIVFVGYGLLMVAGGYLAIDKQKRDNFWGWILMGAFALYFGIVFFG